MSASSTVQWSAQPGLALHSHPEALEVGVEISGAQGGGSARALFTENTVTTLVFEDGAVVQLGAAVAVGQLVFLKQLKSQREIVARVLKQRSFGTGNAYVELEFTEAAPGFWGAEIAPAKNETKEALAENHAAGEAAGEMYELLTNAEPKETEKPQEAIGGIALQMGALLEGGGAARPVSSVAASVAAALDAADLFSVQGHQAENKADSKPLSAGSGLKAAGENSGELGNIGGAVAALAVAPARAKADEALAEKKFSGGEEEAFAEEVAAIEEAEQVEEAGAEAAPAERGNANLRVWVMAALLALTLVGGAVWQRDAVAGWFGKGKQTEPELSAGDAGPASAPKGVVVAPAGSGATANGGVEAGATAVENDAVDSRNGSQNALIARPREDAEGKKQGAAVTNRQNDAAADAASGAYGAADAEDGYEPPKLVKAVNAVAPPEAVQGFVTGDVKCDALIDATGKVASATVIAGPEVLRAAALEALRNYQYKPASKNGKAVAAHAEVSVKFWYEP